LYTARCQHSKEEAAALRAAIATSTAEAKTLAQRLKDSEAAAAPAVPLLALTAALLLMLLLLCSVR
jgi:CHASE3 domain sensor protein